MPHQNRMVPILRFTQNYGTLQTKLNANYLTNVLLNLNIVYPLFFRILITSILSVSPTFIRPNFTTKNTKYA